ncbi:unnamed protein product [Parnassius apollo]|uniref:(apollo) hypothetical protein n=1 Tax=Parnassius apollo TaxID=110799 RepID=A0A8S3Y8E4_PARAO|nr:unnamed protein product [Parnassius apollo]
MACTDTETGGIANENSPYHRMPTSASILEGLNSITTIANNIITTISAGRSVTSDSKKAIIEMAHDINRIIRETQIKTEYTASIIEVKESLQNTIKEEISKLSIRTQTKSYASVASTPRPPLSNQHPHMHQNRLLLSLLLIKLILDKKLSNHGARVSVLRVVIMHPPNCKSYQIINFE